MEGTLGQTFRVTASGKGDIMARANKKKAGAGDSEGWLYLGASGILQPLSEEFLYRSPGRSLHRSMRRSGSHAAEVRHDDV
jgi:hypothetical protein